MFVCDARAISITSESVTPIRIPAMIPKKRIPTPAPMQNSQSLRLTR